MPTAARWTADDPPPFGTRMSDEEWESLGEDVGGELVDGVLVEEDLVGHPFVGPFWIEAVGSGKVDDRSVNVMREGGRPAFLIDGDPRKVADFLVETGEGVKEGTLPAVRIAYEGNMDIILLQEGKGREGRD